ncbi:MAG: tRNA pseudouridine(38-40) synthase TruA [Ignavibacteria bacterium]
MRNFKIYLEYCGTNYSGWQIQKNAKTIQGVLTDCINRVFSNTKGTNKLIELVGAGRTDKGVHALEQVAHLKCETMLAPEILKMKTNDLLPSDINILEIKKAPLNFHARHSAKYRQYLYVISKRRTAFEKKYVWWIKDRLNVDLMKKTATLFKGMHNFSSFADKETQENSTLVFVENISLDEAGEKIFLRIKASHFLWKMVRRIVGSLVEVGRRNLSPADIKFYLENSSTDLTRYTAPPSGLFLEKVFY